MLFVAKASSFACCSSCRSTISHIRATRCTSIHQNHDKGLNGIPSGDCVIPAQLQCRIEWEASRAGDRMQQLHACHIQDKANDELSDAITSARSPAPSRSMLDLDLGHVRRGGSDSSGHVDNWILFIAWSLYRLLAFSFVFHHPQPFTFGYAVLVHVPIQHHTFICYILNVNILPPNTHISQSAQRALANRDMHIMIQKSIHI